MCNVLTNYFMKSLLVMVADGRAIAAGANFNAQLSYDYNIEDYKQNIVRSSKDVSFNQLASQSIQCALQVSSKCTDCPEIAHDNAASPSRYKGGMWFATLAVPSSRRYRCSVRVRDHKIASFFTIFWCYFNRSNTSGQLGVENDGRDCEVPVVIESLVNIRDVRCGEAHSLALDGWYRKMAF